MEPQSGNEKRKREAAIEKATRKGERIAKAKVKSKKAKVKKHTERGASVPHKRWPAPGAPAGLAPKPIAMYPF